MVNLTTYTLKQPLTRISSQANIQYYYKDNTNANIIEGEAYSGLLLQASPHAANDLQTQGLVSSSTELNMRVSLWLHTSTPFTTHQL